MAQPPHHLNSILSIVDTPIGLLGYICDSVQGFLLRTEWWVDHTVMIVMPTEVSIP